MKLVFARRSILASCLAGSLGLLASAQALPDLIIARYLAKTTIEYKRRAFSADECPYVEGCVLATGARKLLLLDVGIKNVGLSDLVIGDPAASPNLFEWSDCHEHYHLKGLATYRVLTLSGRQVARTYKQGFCLRDDYAVMPRADDAKYTCDDQGISVGWLDHYYKSLDCQWVDITGVPPGKYNLVITVNPYRVLKESNYQNNTTVIPITVPRNVYY